MITTPISLSAINHSALVSFTLAYPADEWGPYTETYSVWQADTMRGILANSRMAPERILNPEVLATGRKVDITK